MGEVVLVLLAVFEFEMVAVEERDLESAIEAEWVPVRIEEPELQEVVE